MGLFFDPEADMEVGGFLETEGFESLGDGIDDFGGVFVGEVAPFD